ncbi:hypothetical protein [Colwellia ponticola]|uniref:Uncharacterized protein n=1 Tax=Colwellia ponticola TaxID=2304625 RepID=A0A8H2PLD2_9GAMM|nr:hypothetical protein [Colwellia ponticola]TMM44759.1 hypothetical protein FCS21_10825 [Colwellia ponticola]
MNINLTISLKKLYIIILRRIVVTFIIVNSTFASAINNDNIAFEQSLAMEKWRKVPDTKLAGSRGGFLLPNGVIIDISFEKRIFRNGEETSSAYFQIPNNLNLIKNGQLNNTELAKKSSNQIADSLFHSIIQNDLDNQTLQTINNINIDIKNLNNINLTPSNNQFFNLHSLKI